MKLDTGKLDYSLLHDAAIEELVAVLTFGARKYAPGNWAQIERAEDRYYAALQRHLSRWRQGEVLDPETRLRHLAHALCCCMFLLAFDQSESPEPQRVEDRMTQAIERLLQARAAKGQ